jgi:hypothetical protein
MACRPAGESRLVVALVGRGFRVPPAAAVTTAAYRKFVAEGGLAGVLDELRRQRVPVRDDLWAWLEARQELTGEPADSIAERALAQYRARLEGGPGAELPSVDMHAASTPGPAP